MHTKKTFTRNSVTVWRAALALSNLKRILLLTCEHGGNRIPPKYAKLFQPHRALLKSHRGYDIGALACAQYLHKKLAQHINTQLYSTSISRLLVDLNRSIGHKQLFSDITNTLSAAEKQIIITSYYQPLRQEVIDFVRTLTREKIQVIHLSIHSFTPILNGVKRRCDIGLLYDPKRSLEAQFCSHWQALLQSNIPALRVRRNYPYRGSADGHTTQLRRIFPKKYYAGIEVEINQAVVENAIRFASLKQVVHNSLHYLITQQ